ncbi:MAG: xanthine dehydrogenase family protein molybdopterin-binding subunit [Thermodesulfobacteriota bacterium]|nr:xanthine dehydrogenase family protein molybdopterin-binding subunit [Thermodesulfobacteriota bacterium]
MKKAEENKMESIGRSPVRLDAKEKVAGRTIFTVDLKLTGMLHAKALRSPFPHARILQINAAKARALPGVSAIVTGQDYPGLLGVSIQDQNFLARDKVRFVGDAVAAVAAADLDTAEEALSLIRVEYEPLPGLFDPVEAMKVRDVLIHENLAQYPLAPGIFPVAGTNICNYFKLRKGDVGRGFRESYIVLEDTYTSHMVQHAHLEPHASIAQVDPSGKILIWTNTQTPYFNRKALANGLGLPLNKVRVIVPPIGGGFGGKTYLKAEPICVALALKTKGRPVKLVYTREEEFQVAPVRHPTIIRCKTGMKRDGAWMAQETELIFDTGAYADAGPRVCRSAGLSAAGPYKVPNVHVDSYCVYTNNPIGGAFRGFGVPQITWAIESHLDVLAGKLGIDSIELRLKNSVEEGSISATGQALHSVGLKETIQQAAMKIGWGQNPGPNRGKGIACMHKSTVTPSSSAAFVKLNEDASVTLLCSAVEMGQGATTALAQIASEELGIPVEKIAVVCPDTDVTPYDMASVSSRSTFFVGNAVRRAAADAREQLLQIASEILEADPKDLMIEAGNVFIRGFPGKGLPIAELPLGEAFYVGAKGRGRGKPVLGRGAFSVEDATPLDRETGQGKNPSAFWLYAAQAAEVEVDRRSGRVKVLRIASAHDLGKSIHPVAIEGQIQGALVMGVGTALYEEMELEKGKVKNPNFAEYKIPSALDAPEMIPLIVEEPHANGPYGAKGLGEPALAPTAAAIANAIYAAVGVRIKDLPITPEKILEGLRKNKKAAGISLEF